eukprot:TRINITY_DN7798_c0_g1_i1.p1 TRINITY_DN7798_c0_g1~~TRINITY_DN7798_c0_g1_i1.p1  ORF type:complete len:510 (+),score=92.62 TRINITY_DN7798_c0_g1_i1:937-2466(+)
MMIRLYLVLFFLHSITADSRTEIVPAGIGLIGKKTVLKADMKRGEVVFNQDLSEGVHADNAVQAVFGHRGSSEKHELSSLLSARQLAGKSQEDLSTAYTPPHLLLQDDVATEIAMAMQLVDKYDSWYSDHYIFDSDEISQLSPGFQTEFSLITKRADEWYSILSQLGSSSWKPRFSTAEKRSEIKKKLLWVSLILRQHGLLSPYGTLIAPETVGIRQAHSGCNVLRLQATDEYSVSGVLEHDAKKGSEVCIAYSPSLSRQELLVRHYIWDDKLPIGIHYYISESEEDDPTLQSNGCLAGEITLSKSGKLSSRKELCFRLAQLPPNVRYDHKELFKGKESQKEVLAALGTLTLTALSSYYAVSDVGGYRFSEETGIRTESVFDLLDTRGDEGDMPPELVALIKEREEQSKGRKQETVTEEEEEEYVPIPELETEELVDVTPTPDYILRLDSNLQSVVPELIKFLGHTHHRWTESVDSILKVRQSYDQAEAERVREQVRRNLEDYELSGDL